MSRMKGRTVVGLGLVVLLLTGCGVASQSPTTRLAPSRSVEASSHLHSPLSMQARGAPGASLGLAGQLCCLMGRLVAIHGEGQAWDRRRLLLLNQANKGAHFKASNTRKKIPEMQATHLWSPNKLGFRPRV